MRLAHIFHFTQDLHIRNSEDMVRVLGKRPFEGKSDDMDKYLDDEVCPLLC